MGYGLKTGKNDKVDTQRICLYVLYNTNSDVTPPYFGYSSY